MLLAKRKIFFAIVVLVVIVVLFIIYREPAAGGKAALINGNKLEIEIADTDLKRYRGLSSRDYLCSNCGMLFIFPDKALRDFVMRDMKFNLDILWVADGKIIEIKRNLPAEGKGHKKIYSSDKEADMVLEVNAGYCDKHGIAAGQIIDLTF